MSATGQKELAKKFAKRKGITFVEANKQIKEVVDLILDEVVDNEKGVTFRGKFTIFKKLRKGRKGTMNGKSYEAPDHYTLRIKTGKDLEEFLNR